MSLLTSPVAITALSAVAVIISVLTWWRHRRRAWVAARFAHGGRRSIMLVNTGSAPAYNVSATIRYRSSDLGPVPRGDLWTTYLPISRLDAGATFGLPMKPIPGRQDPVYIVSVSWSRYGRQRPTRTIEYPLSTITDDAKGLDVQKLRLDAERSR